ncbi:unnamed protein product, partial [Linum tenue]
EAIFNLKQGTLSVSQYYSKQRALWDQLANYRFIPDCECGITCHCVLATLRKDHMNDKVIRFLRNLNDSFNGPRSTVMLLDPLPPINKVFAMMVQHERENGLLPKPQPAHNPASESMAFFTKAAGQHLGVQGAGQGFKKQSKKPVCTFCGYTGHTEDVCYKKNGYPPGYQSKKKQMPSRQANSVSIDQGSSTNGAVMINHSDWQSFQQQYQKMLSFMTPFTQQQNVGTNGHSFGQFPAPSQQQQHSLPAPAAFQDAYPTNNPSHYSASNDSEGSGHHNMISRANSVASHVFETAEPSGLPQFENDWNS